MACVQAQKNVAGIVGMARAIEHNDLVFQSIVLVGQPAFRDEHLLVNANQRFQLAILGVKFS